MFHMKRNIYIFVHNFERFSPRKVEFASCEPKPNQNIVTESSVAKEEKRRG